MARLRVVPVRLPLRAPLRTAWGELRERDLLRVELEAGDGLVGVGEAAPLEPYDGVPLAAVRATLDAYARALEPLALASADPSGSARLPEEAAPSEPPASEPAPSETPPASARPGELALPDWHRAALDVCRAERDLSPALAAIDLALWDLAGLRAGRPVAELLHRRPLAAVPVNATIGTEDRATAAAEATAAVAAGFRCVKVKVGVGDDGGRVAAVRAAVGPDTLIRVDANGAWSSPEEALANLRVLAPIGIELAEEPVHGVDALRAVRAASPVPIAADETHAPGSGAADAVCLKISRSGGITGVLRDAAAARAAGSAVYVASTFDGPIGIAAGLHAAAALGAGALLPHCGLATLQAFAAPDPLPADAGLIGVPDAPGLGQAPSSR
jgi:L-alanine-DL-glutamate epimerase-like enolase superfamily enzyme